MFICFFTIYLICCLFFYFHVCSCHPHVLLPIDLNSNWNLVRPTADPNLTTLITTSTTPLPEFKSLNETDSVTTRATEPDRSYICSLEPDIGQGNQYMVRVFYNKIASFTI